MSRLQEGYKLPEWRGGYSKLDSWDNRFRVLSKPITGWVYFNHDKKPVRVKEKSEVVVGDIWEGLYGKQCNHFWAFVVYDSQKEDISILEITKKSVLKSFKNYLMDPDYLDPTEYDIIISKEWSGTDTKYGFRVGKHSAIPDEVKEAYEAMTINLEAVYGGGNPYEDTQEAPGQESKF
jgi:hypothetical protein